MIAAYCLVYFLGQPFALRSAALSRVWATAFYPLRLVQYHGLYSGEIREEGTLRQNAVGSWSLTYTEPKGDPHQALTEGIAFRVPSKLSAAAAASNRQRVAMTIAREPDPDRFNCARYVLTSVSPLQ